MQLGMIGLGRMGANLVRRLLRDGHDCAVYDLNTAAVAELASEGATAAAALNELVAKLAAPRVVWVMLPAAAVEQTLRALRPQLAAGDVVIDGGNTPHHEDIRRAREFAEDGIHYVDVGTSGGVLGLDRGYCLMIGGEDAVVERLDPIFASLAPGRDAAPRTPGREGTSGSAEQGYLHCGPAGAGHFVKMVHNGIEYGIMAAYAEGLNVLRHADSGRTERGHDAETSPLEHPERYQYEIPLAEVAEVWRRGSVIGSFLLDLTAKALLADPELRHFDGRVSDSGEGRWTLQAAIDEGVPVHVLSAALFDRFSSRGEAGFANQLLSAMRFEFGGHHEKKGG